MRNKNIGKAFVSTLTYVVLLTLLNVHSTESHIETICEHAASFAFRLLSRQQKEVAASAIPASLISLVVLGTVFELPGTIYVKMTWDDEDGGEAYLDNIPWDDNVS